MLHPARAVRALAICALFVLWATPAAAQRRTFDRDWESDCSRWSRDRDSERYCDVVESTMTAPSGTGPAGARAADSFAPRCNCSRLYCKIAR